MLYRFCYIRFKRGERVAKCPESDLLDLLLLEVEKMTGEKVLR